MAGPILVLGCTGGFGRAMANELLARGRVVRLFVRNVDRGRAIFGNRPNGEIVEGDADDAEALRKSAEGCSAIVHALNFPYHRWASTMPRVTDAVISAARAAAPVILFPGNVYGLGAQTGRPVDESAENTPCSRKGELRVALEDALRKGSADGVCRVLVVRAGDYYGPTVRNPLVDGVFERAREGRPPRLLGDPSRPHQWAYTPDLARAAADLLERVSGLEPFEVVHFAGHTFSSQAEFCGTVSRLAGREGVRPARVPWAFVRAAGLFNPVMREVLELRYLWDSPVILDDAKLHRLLPAFKGTAPEDAIKATLNSYRG